MRMLQKKTTGIIRQYDLGKKRNVVLYISIYVILAAMVLVALFPAIWVGLAGFKDLREFQRVPKIFPENWSLKGFVDTWNRLGFMKYYANSLISLLGCIVCSVVFNGLTAYALTILKPKGSGIVQKLITLSLMIPATVGIVPLFININNMGLKGSFIPIWFAFGANAFYVVLFSQFFRSFPVSLLEASRLDGCSDIRALVSIVFPLSISIVMVVVIYTINAAWSDFLLPYLVLNGTGKETVMVRLFLFRTGTANDIDVLRAITFAIIPPIILFLFCSKTITRSVMQGGIKE